MLTARPLARDDPAYPPSLRQLATVPSLWVAGDTTPAPTVAIVGSRKATRPAIDFAVDLAGALARAGIVVVSGGAFGIDAAAHCGALAAGGRTWCVLPTGPDHVFPPEHTPLFEAIARGPGAVLWPFPPESEPESRTRYDFFRRNQILVNLSGEVVVVQAGVPSGALNAAHWTRRMGRPLWVVTAGPWEKGFEGSHQELARGARPLTSVRQFFEAHGWSDGGSHSPRRSLPATGQAHPAALDWPLLRAASAEEMTLYSALTDEPLHVDAIADRSRLPLPTLAGLLLTLALENVLVEGPHGHFRRAKRL